MTRLTRETPCCEMMAFQLNQECDQHPDPFDCPDNLVGIFPNGDVGLIVHDGGHSMILIERCPWCGTRTGTTIDRPEEATRPSPSDRIAPHEYRASLRVQSETLTLDELIDRLGEPTHSSDIGDPVSRRNPDGAKRKHAHWGLDSRKERAEPLDEHIRELLYFAERHRQTLAALRPDCEMDIFCGIFTSDDLAGGFDFDPELMRRTAELGLALTFDLY